MPCVHSGRVAAVSSAGAAAPAISRLKLSAKPLQLNRSKGQATHSTCKRLCVCTAATPAQLDSARAQESGVGKAQAGTARCRTGYTQSGTTCNLLFIRAAHSYEAAASSSRKGRVERQTKETKVDVSIGIDGTGRCKTRTPIHFLNHMLDVS